MNIWLSVFIVSLEMYIPDIQIDINNPQEIVGQMNMINILACFFVYLRFGHRFTKLIARSAIFSLPYPNYLSIWSAISLNFSYYVLGA